MSTDINSFTLEQQSKRDVLVGEHLPVNPNHLTPEQRSKADVYVGENAMAGQYVPSKATPSGALTSEEQSKRRVIVGEDAGAGQYIEDMTQTFGGMSEGLEAAQANTREAIVNSLSPELRSKADVYVGEANSNNENNPWRPEGAGSRPDDYAGMGYSEPRVEAGTITPKAIDAIKDFETLMQQATTEDEVYITEDEYDAITSRLNEDLSKRYDTEGPTPTGIGENMLQTKLDENWEYSQGVDNYHKQTEEAGLSDLQDVTEMLEDSDIRSVMDRVIRDAPVRDSSNISKPRVSSMLIDVPDQATQLLLYAVEIESYEDTEKKRDICNVVGGALGMVWPGVLTPGWVTAAMAVPAAGPTLAALIEIDASDLSSPKLIKTGRKYRRYQIEYDEQFPNGNNMYTVTVYVEVDERGEPLESPHVYVYDRVYYNALITQGSSIKNVIDFIPEYYECGE